MTLFIRTAAVLSIACLSLFLASCGGGGSGTGTPGPRAAGRFAPTVKWPEPSRLIPAASNSIKAVLTFGGATLGQQILVRPQQPPWTTTVTFDCVTPGTVTLTATAYPTAGATGTAQATGAANATITADHTTAVTVTMASTITTLEVTPPTSTIQPGETVQLTATPKDAQGNVVLVAPGNISFSSGTPATATVGQATGLVAGVAASANAVTMTASESESGKTGTASVIVNVVTPPANILRVPEKIVMNPNRPTAYVINGGGLSFNAPGFVSQHRVNADGTLSGLTATTLPTQTHPTDIAIDKTGSFVYVTDFGDVNDPGRVYQFKANADGTLSALSPATVTQFVNHPNGLLLTPDGKYLFVANGDGNPAPSLITYQVGANGTLTELSAALAQGIPDFMVTDPAGKFLFASNQTGAFAFIINPDGSLTPNGSINGRTFDIAVDSTGQSLYATDIAADLLQFKINGDGTLVALSPASLPAGQVSQGLAITPNNPYVYASDATTFNAPGAIWQYKRNANGTLTALSPASVPTANAPDHLTVDPTGSFLYVPCGNSDSIQVFHINANGSLTLVQ